MYVLDTNIVSELRRVRPHGGVLAWIGDVASHDLHLAAVTVAELQSGIEMCRGHDRDKAIGLEAWLDAVLASFTVLPMDGSMFRRWARLMHKRPEELRVDAMIAATALAHGFVVVTRNVQDFEVFGVEILNPFELG